MTFIRQPLSTIVVCLLLVSCFTGCSVKLDVSPYDAWTDKQVTAINGKVQKFFIKMAGSDDEHRKYKYHKAGYEDVLADLMILLTRTEIREDRIMEENVKICIASWKALISAHKEGNLSTGTAIHKGLETDFQKAYEASKRVSTAATSEQMETKIADSFLEKVAETFLQKLRNIIGTELSKKEN